MDLACGLFAMDDFALATMPVSCARTYHRLKLDFDAKWGKRGMHQLAVR